MDPMVRPGGFVGRAVERVEDDALLRGRGRFVDDVPVAASTLHAAVLRSPHAHARITALDASAALTMPGVRCVLTGDDVRGGVIENCGHFIPEEAPEILLEALFEFFDEA